MMKELSSVASTWEVCWIVDRGDLHNKCLFRGKSRPFKANFLRPSSDEEGEGLWLFPSVGHFLEVYLEVPVDHVANSLEIR